MRIESSQLVYAAAHRAVSADIVAETTVPRQAAPAKDVVHLSQAVRTAATAADREDLQDLDPKQRLAVLVLEAILGHRLHFTKVNVQRKDGQSAPGADAGTIRQRVEAHAESEQTSFAARGEVQTTDGRSIRFSVQLSLQREYESVTATTGSAKSSDPLVVNFGGGTARLTDAKISFDLGSDGSASQISFVANGSGFLALDRNGDGKVNDGRELFGPATGDGFAELAAYDADRNGWIDENDPVFADLRLWTQDGLWSLKDKGIGAIAVAAIGTPFSIRDLNNTAQGELRQTGLYLGENGGAGTVQQVDLVES